MKKITGIIFLFFFGFTLFLAKPSRVFAFSCGDNFIDTEGRWGTPNTAYVTACYLIYVNGRTVYPQDNSCGLGKQCFVFEQFQGRCGGPYIGRPTYCAQIQPGLQTAPYSGCHTTEKCFVGNVSQGTCGKDLYLGQPTYCSSIVIGNRRPVPDYQGCGQQMCVSDIPSSEQTKVCGRDAFQNQPTYCSVSSANRLVVGYSGCRAVGEMCVTDLTSQVGASQGPTPMCTLLPDEPSRIKCDSCFAQGGAWTAIGCIPSNPTQFIAILLKLGIGIAGGIAFLLTLFGGFQILTSTGNPEQLNAGKELVGSAIAGLLLIIFSIFILRVIGVNILGIPGFQ